MSEEKNTKLTFWQRRTALRNRGFLFIGGVFLSIFGWAFSDRTLIIIGPIILVLGLAGIVLYFTSFKNLKRFYVIEVAFSVINGILFTVFAALNYSEIGKFGITNPVVIFLFAIFSFYGAFANYKKYKQATS